MTARRTIRPSDEDSKSDRQELQLLQRQLAESTLDQHREAIARAESERTQHSLFENMLNSVAHCRVICDASGQAVDLEFLRVNRAFAEASGLTGAAGKRATDLIPDVMVQDPQLLEAFSRIASTGTADRFETELRSRRQWLSISAYSPSPGECVAVFDVITDRKRIEAISRMQGRIMESIASGKPLRAVLESLCLQIEAFDVGTLVSVQLLDEDGITLRHGAAPSLPASFNEAIDGRKIGPDAGSCGSAAYTGKPVTVEDIGTDPLWERFRELAVTHGLRACWSTPIVDHASSVVGTFALYRREPWRPRPYQDRIVAMATHAAAVAIGRHHEEQLLRKLSLAVDQSAESMVITDLAGNIEYVNDAFTRISGYTRAEVVGKKPAILRSGRTPDETY